MQNETNGIVAESGQRRLRLRRTQEADLEFVLKAETDAENSPFIGQWTREQHRNIFAKPDMAHLIIEGFENALPIGYAILDGLQNPDQSIELKRIVVTVKGHGYGKEAIELIKEWVFESLDAHRLWLDFKDYNQRGRHVYQAVGFVQEGILRESLKVGNRFESLVVMSILRHEYFSNRHEGSN